MSVRSAPVEKTTRLSQAPATPPVESRSLLGRGWHIARNDLRIWLRERGTVFWSFLGPFMFVLFFGILFKDDPGPGLPAVWLRNEDSSQTFASAVHVLLQEGGVTVRLAATDSAAGAYRLVIPAGSADTLAAGRPPHVVLHVPSESPTPRERTLVAETTRALLGAYLGLTPEEAHAALDTTAVRARVVVDPRMLLVQRTLDVPEPSVGFQRTLPAYLVMFLFMTLLTSGVELLVAERRTGQLRRVLVSSVGSGALVLGKMLSRFTLGWMQIAVMLTVGALVFKVRFGAHPEALFVVLLAFALCATGLGLLFATFFRNADKAAGFGSMLTLIMAPLGGCWWPLEIVPGWMRTIAFLLPTGWAFDGLNRVMALDSGLGPLWPHLLYLLGLAAISLPLAIRRIARAT